MEPFFEVGSIYLFHFAIALYFIYFTYFYTYVHSVHDTEKIHFGGPGHLLSIIHIKFIIFHLHISLISCTQSLAHSGPVIHIYFHNIHCYSLFLFLFTFPFPAVNHFRSRSDAAATKLVWHDLLFIIFISFIPAQLLTFEYTRAWLA